MINSQPCQRLGCLRRITLQNRYRCKADAEIIFRADGAFERIFYAIANANIQGNMQLELHAVGEPMRHAIVFEQRSLLQNVAKRSVVEAKVDILQRADMYFRQGKTNAEQIRGEIRIARALFGLGPAAVDVFE